MLVEFRLPDVGEGLEQGEIVSWLVAPGDTVARDQPLVEVQTDKALVELPSPVAGRVVSVGFTPGDMVKVGQVLVVLEDGAGEAGPVGAGKAGPVGAGEAASVGAAELAAGAPEPALAAELASATATPPLPTPLAGARPKAAPAVRKRAVELGIDLAAITGTGPGGRILAADVEQAAGRQGAPAPAVAETGPTLGQAEPGRHPLRGIRRVTAEVMARSWSEIPHITNMDEFDATGLLAARRRLAEATGGELTVAVLLVAAVARGLRRFPLVNASLEGDEVVVHPDRNVGLAVATPNGLVVPVIRQADRQPIADLAAEVRRLTEAARAQRVTLDELRGGTFTVTNYGSLGGRFATPLIRPPEVGIMGFGAIRPRPLVVDGEVVARPTLPWCLSTDHRLVDGDLAVAFAESVTGLLADPLALLAELLVEP